MHKSTSLSSYLVGFLLLFLIIPAFTQAQTPFIVMMVPDTTVKVGDNDVMLNKCPALR